MEGNSIFRWLLAGLCWVQVGGATAAAVAAFVEVETIIAFGPAIALLGMVLALVSLQSTFLNLLLFGLLCPVTTSAIALLIAWLEWSPGEAAVPVPVLLTLNAGITAVWGPLTARQIIRTRRLDASSGKAIVRFSLLNLLGLVTVACLLLALLRQIPGGAEMMWFAVYGIGVLVLGLAVAAWFSYRVKYRVLEGNRGRKTSPPITENAM
jgi:hypothetical protein